MAKKSKRSSGTKKHDDHHHNDEITDERFAAATTRPQFTKAKSSLSTTNYTRKNKNYNNNNNAKNRVDGHVDGDVDDDGGALINKSAVSSSSGLGDSLTRAIASDDRFSAALDSDKFGCVPTRDKYGRKTKKKKKGKKQQPRRDDNEEGKRVEDGVEEDYGEGEKDESDDDERSEAEKKEEENGDGGLLERDDSMETRIAYLNALSRGDISASSSSDDSSDDGDRDDDNDEYDDDGSTSSTDIRGKAGIFDPSHAPLPGDIDAEGGEGELTFEPSPYLCILNLNWEHTRAVDVYAMLHSFCPPGTLERVEVYPSDFGKERMEKERREGPVGLWKKEKKKKDDEDDDSEEGSSSNGESDEDDDSDNNNNDVPSSYQSDNHEGNSESDDDDDTDSDTEEPLNLAEATSQLYSHFPPQSSISKNSNLNTPEEEEEGFDVEKLREYEASKLRYYFAIATFRSPAAAEAVYENVDGMEMEGSAAEIDVRVLPPDAYGTTVEGRTARDAWSEGLPARYAPPDNSGTVAALRQSRVSCSWERGDAARESKLTRYGMGKEAWEALAEGDDIGFYLATSDNSSVEDGDDDDEEEEGMEAKKKKGSGMRALLGLAGSDGEESGDDGSSGESDDDSDASEAKGADSTEKHRSTSSSTESDSEDEADAGDDADRQVTFTPGKRALEAKIRSRLSQKSGRADEARDDAATTTPFEKYLEKRREKRRERRKAARGGGKDESAEEEDDGGMYGVDPEFGAARFSDEEGDEGDVGGGDGNDNGGDGFFLGDSTKTTQKGKRKKKEEQSLSLKNSVEDAGIDKVVSTKEELELLIAGDDVEEHEKDYDMRGLAKLERDATKKLKGKRKRKLQTLASNLPGQDFRIDASDDRFAALLDGNDDRYGIDRTNPAYKETGAMKTLLEEQSKRRRRRAKGGTSGNDGGGGREGKKKDGASAGSEDKGGGGWVERGSGAMELSSLVKSLQRKVPKKSADGSKRKKKKRT